MPEIVIDREVAKRITEYPYVPAPLLVLATRVLEQNHPVTIDRISYRHLDAASRNILAGIDLHE